MTNSTERLTHAERSCLQSVARGESPDTLAEQFGDDQETISKHLASARRKLLAATTIEAVARALKMGLIE